MTTLDDATTASTVSTRLVGRVARGLGRFSRRGFLVQTAVVGSALAVDAKGYVLRPQTAASTVCGPDASCSDGYTVMCCTINNGVNACPPGTFAAGWWKAADSSWCCGGYRYITDCNATCRDCTSGCSGDHICDKGCWSCSCTCGSTATCDQRRVCCNAFRYGQCNTQVRCSGGVACRVVSCVPPYAWENCTTTSLSDNTTAEHNAPCLQRCGPILRHYDSLGGPGSPLGASIGHEHALDDSRGGSYGSYQHGVISFSDATHAHAVYGYAFTRWSQLGREGGVLGYPVREKVVGSDRWIQYFEKGVMADTTASSTSVVTGWPFTRWKQLGAESGPLGYPTSDKIGDTSWVQHFEHGALGDTPSTSTSTILGWPYTYWKQLGAQDGPLGIPTSDKIGDTSWVQYFQHGAMGDTPTTSTSIVTGWPFTYWKQLGAQDGVLGIPTGDRVGTDSWVQHFEHGVMADTPASSTTVVTGAVLDQWLADGAQDGRWGYPVEDAVTEPDGGVHQRFQGGVIRV